MWSGPGIAVSAVVPTIFYLVPPLRNPRISHASYIKQIFLLLTKTLNDNNEQSTLYNKRGLPNLFATLG